MEEIDNFFYFHLSLLINLGRKYNMVVNDD